MAFTRVNPVVSHWAVDWSMDISTIIEGNAGVTRVWFSTVTKAPSTKTVNISHCLRVSFMHNTSFASRFSLACASGLIGLGALVSLVFARYTDFVSRHTVPPPPQARAWSRANGCAPGTFFEGRKATAL